MLVNMHNGSTLDNMGNVQYTGDTFRGAENPDLDPQALIKVNIVPRIVFMYDNIHHTAAFKRNKPNVN